MWIAYTDGTGKRNAFLAEIIQRGKKLSLVGAQLH